MKTGKFEEDEYLLVLNYTCRKADKFKCLGVNIIYDNREGVEITERLRAAERT